jgi:hypothetical protein
MRYAGRDQVWGAREESSRAFIYITENGARLYQMELARPFRALLKRCERGFLDSTNRNCMARMG